MNSQLNYVKLTELFQQQNMVCNLTYIGLLKLELCMQELFRSIAKNCSHLVSLVVYRHPQDRMSGSEIISLLFDDVQDRDRHKILRDIDRNKNNTDYYVMGLAFVLMKSYKMASLTKTLEVIDIPFPMRSKASS